MSSPPSGGRIVNGSAAVRSPLQVLESFFQMSNLLRNRLAPRLAELGLSDARLAVLTCVESGEKAGMTQAEIALRLCQSESNISGIVERMRRDRLLSRRRSTIDRRRCEIRLLPSGVSLLTEVRKSESDWMREVLLEIPGREREELLLTLQQLMHFLMLSTLPPAIRVEPNADKMGTPTFAEENQDAA